MAEAYTIGYMGSNSKMQVRATAWRETRLDSSVGLVLILAVTLIMTQTHRFVCASCVQSRRGMFDTPYPTLRAPVCRVAGLGVKEVKLETRPTDAMVGSTGAAWQSPDLRH